MGGSLLNGISLRGAEPLEYIPALRPRVLIHGQVFRPGVIHVRELECQQLAAEPLRWFQPQSR